MAQLRVLSWNVNGIRACLKKNLPDFVATHQPDILALQETKASQSQVDLKSYPAFSDYYQYWCDSVRKGYSGTLILTKKPAISVQLGMGIEGNDEEGRLISAEFEDFVLVNVYTPNSKPDLSRLEYRELWDRHYADHLLKLRKNLKKPLLACGDFNVAHREIDLARPIQNDGKHGFTRQEREGFDHILAKVGLVDTYRAILGDTVGYSYWSMANGSRKTNVGWRIDYFLADSQMMPLVKNAFILEHVEGSDHAPVGVDIEVPSSAAFKAKP